MNQQQHDNLKKAVETFLENVDITKFKRCYKPRQKNPQTKFVFTDSQKTSKRCSRHS